MGLRNLESDRSSVRCRKGRASKRLEFFFAERWYLPPTKFTMSPLTYFFFLTIFCMGDGINELANVLNKQIKESGKRDVSVDFGTIEKNGFLITDIIHFP